MWNTLIRANSKCEQHETSSPVGCTNGSSTTGTKGGAPLHYGFSTHADNECIVHVVQSLTKLYQQTATILFGDGINAYDQNFRVAMMDGLFSLCNGEGNRSATSHDESSSNAWDPEIWPFFGLSVGLVLTVTPTSSMTRIPPHSYKHFLFRRFRIPLPCMYRCFRPIDSFASNVHLAPTPGCEDGKDWLLQTPECDCTARLQVC